MERREMDWKRLVQFALQGSSDLEQYAILLIRVSIGLFFAISGANKLFVAGGTKPICDTLVEAKAPFPRQLAYFVDKTLIATSRPRGVSRARYTSPMPPAPSGD
jgi:hypothetical protein